MIRTRRTLLSAAVAAAVLSLSACKNADAPQAAPSDVAPGQEAAIDGPDAKPGIEVTGARLVLPIVPERPGVVYFTLRNGAPAAATLVSANVAGVGKAEMHKTQGGRMMRANKVQIAPGASLAFEPGGLHVMAFDIDDKLKAGGETELTLTFADGDKISVAAKIQTMGDAAEMHH